MLVIKMTKENIQLIINDEIIEGTPTNLGLTNDIYKAMYHGVRVAIRVPKDETKDLSTFDNEHLVLPLIQDLNLDAKELYYDSSTRIRITQWIDNSVEFKDCSFDDKIIRSAKLIRKLHDSNIVTRNEFNPVSLLHEYRGKITHLLHPIDDYFYLTTKLQAIDNPHHLCHNDLVSGNLLFTDDQDYLIDYEYAKDNDPLFDIMSFITENNIIDKTQREQFYTAYFSEPLTDKIRNELMIYEAFHNLLWCTWANMMYNLLQEDIYKVIANGKYNSLLENIKTGDLN